MRSLIIFAACAFVSAQDFECPTKVGFYADPYQCDLYYKCSKGEAEPKLCPDGLVFADENPNKELCDIPSNVECGDRKELQEPKPSPGCPRQNGYFKHPDPQACDKFNFCSDGVPNEHPCPPGLYFNEETSNCDWKESVRRTCDQITKDVLDDGFACPDGDVMGPNGRALPHPTFPHPEDCQKFYICRNGVQPQKGSCPSGKVYNEDTFMCDEPEKVQGCENYYEGQPTEKNKLPKKA
ncbi:protein obstructor-E-like [Maniola hyperantus]|uniref:protein obstructor-E-like n=1 Tax=Aphantopus hyperantus TaxID=2795564 RepID=UPI0015693EE0|nr:protein obstructor-E-like [Maniola hyperantus]